MFGPHLFCFFSISPGKKKSGILLISWQSTLGKGTSKSVSQPIVDQELQQKLNFLGPPELSRHLIFAALKETYSDDEALLQDVLTFIMTDMQKALVDGIPVSYDGERFSLRLACLCTKGDWPWLQDSGQLVRHFRRAAKRESANEPNKGICHFCMAGAPGVPCSDPGSNAKWISTMHSASSFFAWESEGPLVQQMVQMPSFPAYIFRPDIFHCWHLGVGQNFGASCLVLLSEMCSGSSIPKRFEELTKLWRNFCRSKCFGCNSHKKRYCLKLSCSARGRPSDACFTGVGGLFNILSMRNINIGLRFFQAL